MGSPWRDMRFAARLLWKERAFSAGAIAVLGLGLGVNTTVFTIINGMNFKGLPVHRGDQIMQLTTVELEGRQRETYTSFADFRDWAAATQTFNGLAVYMSATVNIGDADRAADRIGGWFVSANTFGLLRVAPFLGRVFSAEDDRPGAQRVAMLSYGLWRDRYGADPAIVGRTIRLNGAPATVIGVMPSGFQFPVRADLWQPAVQHPAFDPVRRDRRTFNVFGRLRDDVTVDRARSELRSIAAALAATHPDTNAAMGVSVVPFTEAWVGRATDTPPLLIQAAGVIVLLIACANAANLLLARAAHRTRDVTLRAALGASRARIVRELLVESMLLSLLGGATGLILALAGSRAFARETVQLNLPYWINFGFDARVFAYAAALSLVTAVVCGLVPAWQLSRVRVQDLLKEAGRGSSGTRRSLRWASVLLVSELALTVTLLAGAGLLIRSAAALHEADAVLDLDNLYTAQLAIPAAKVATVDQRRSLFARVQERLEATPGIASVTVASARPFVDAMAAQLVIEGGTAVTAEPRRVQTVAVGDRYFDTLKLPARSGRTFTPDDGAATSDAVVVNERFALLHFGGSQAVGRRIQLVDGRDAQQPARWLTIVGVTPSVRQQPMGRAAPVAYIPLRSQPTPFASVIVRSSDHVTIASLLRQAVHAVDPDVAIYNAEPLRNLSEKSRWTPRMIRTVLALIGLIAMALSAAGLYALTAYGVSQRTSEIGIRMALGARRSQIAGLFLGRTLLQVGVGLIVGMAGALAIGQLLRGLLVETSANDPVTFSSVVLLLIAIAAIACFIPTRRATRLDPMAALRHE